jgi:hypothetical protein
MAIVKNYQHEFIARYAHAGPVSRGCISEMRRNLWGTELAMRENMNIFERGKCSFMRKPLIEGQLKLVPQV